MLRRTIRGAAITVAGLLAVAAVSAPAQADTKTFNDGGGYLTKVKVAHGAKKVTVRAQVGTLTIGSYYTFWLDTLPKNAGPEYKVVIYPNSDGMSVLKVGSFKSAGKAVKCRGFRASADIFGPKVVSIKVPRSCIGNPAKVRVSVRASYAVPGPNVIDWGPGKKKFFGWVRR